MTRLSPVETDCPECGGVGWTSPWVICPRCGGVGKAWIDGAPSFGCQLTLGDQSVGSIVIIGNGDRGRIVRHSRSGTPTTAVALIGDFDESESEPVTYPSCVGVSSVAEKRWQANDQRGDRGDQTDPLRRNK